MVAVSSAMQLVQAAYTLAELLGGEDDALEWVRVAGGDARSALPESLTADNRALTVEMLEAAGATHNGEIDRFRLAEIANVLQLAPFMRAAEDARRPAPTSRLVCTIPPEAVLPAEMRYIQRSLAILVADSLRTPGERVLLAEGMLSVLAVRVDGGDDGGGEQERPGCLHQLLVQVPGACGGRKLDPGAPELQEPLDGCAWSALEPVVAVVVG